ncbi:hypothetical protein C8J57DRAFT_1351069 [Mycena rebaudengoi]|nr:hypothetical protein C8J57DRAFT_1351069 [Mycena rebaudengoi]
MLLFMKWSSERPQFSRNGNPKPGTRIGASQIKKMFFGALRIRKTQEATNPKLRLTRPCATVLVYDETKTRMDEALERLRNGLRLAPEEDAPDIIANTFLAQVTDDQLKSIGYGLLQHRELHQVVNGHLSWTCQNASGNRGDDFRVLKLCEMQPYVFLHPNKETSVYCVLGLQGEEKAGKRGMKTIVNPSYTTFIAHRNPEVCPLGAMAMYFHWLHDVYQLPKKMSIDWESNKSWRNVRLLFGANPVVPYNENSLYSLYCMAYKKSNFESNIKQHLPRHMLGYLQERMGAESSDTAKLGWSRGTYMDTYAPALPKIAILGTHGYKVHENYDPIWRHVRVPEPFLSLMCPDAEHILEKIEGTKNLTGASNYWQMVIGLRPYMFQIGRPLHFSFHSYRLIFQCAAAIYQVQSKSALFKLPALQNPDVRKWMSEVFPVDLKRLQDSEKEPLDLARIQNEALRLSLEEVRVRLVQQTRILERMEQKLKRRTALFSPAKGYSNPLMCVQPKFQMLKHFPSHKLTIIHSLFTLMGKFQTPPVTIDAETRAAEDTGLYEGDDHSLRAFVCASPARKDAPRPRTQVDLVLPPLAAFHKPGAVNPVWPPIFGQKSVAWPEIFPLIHDAHSLFDIWKPSKSMSEMTLAEVWKAWSVGEAVDGPVLGQKPPLRLVGQYFKAKWRSTSKSRKFWERFREIPEWIETETNLGSRSPEASIAELEALRNGLAKQSAVGDEILLIPLGINALAKHLTEQRKASVGTVVGTTNAVESSENSRNGEAAEATSSSIPAKRKAAVASRAKSAKLQKKSK